MFKLFVHCIVSSNIIADTFIMSAMPSLPREVVGNEDTRDNCFPSPIKLKPFLPEKRKNTYWCQDCLCLLYPGVLRSSLAPGTGFLTYVPGAIDALDCCRDAESLECKNDLATPSPDPSVPWKCP